MSKRESSAMKHTGESIGKRPKTSSYSNPRHDPAASQALQQINAGVHLPGPDFKEKLRSTEVVAHTPTASELEELDHLIVNVAYQIEQLLVKFQWLRDVELDNKSGDSVVRTLMKRHRIKLASLLVKQYWLDGIPVFDDIVFTRYATTITTMPHLLGSGSLDPARIDQLQALLLQSAIDSIRTIKQRLQGDQIFLEKTQSTVYELRKSVKNKTKANKKHAEEDDKDESDESAASKEPRVWPPPLPEIRDDTLLKQVLTHKSAVMDASMNTPSALLYIHNERLEFKGDSILDFVVCQMLFNEFPNDSEGSLSVKKSSLVCNDTLFDLAVQYKLHERLKISTDLHNKVYASRESSLPDSGHKHKAIADVFEAYIAGLAMDRGMLVVNNWLQELYQPLIDDMKREKPVEDVDKNAKNELYRKVGSADRPITYANISKISPFTVKCFIGGEEVSSGTDRSIKLAGLRAADAVLKQPELVEKYAAMRREVPKSAPTTGRSLSKTWII